MPQYVFDSPYVGTTAADFDAPTTLGGQAYIQQPTRGELTVTGFAGTLVTGFVSQAARGELTTTGYSGGLVIGTSLNAQMGEVTVTGRTPGSQAKYNGLHYYATDADGDPISFEIQALPLFGTITVEFNGAILYVPNRGFSGHDQILWRPWSNGEAGPTTVLAFQVEPQRQALTGETSDIIGYAPAMAGSGLHSPAEIGEVTVTGFASVGLVTGFVGTALLGELSTTGFAPNLEGALQALAGEVTVTGFAGVTVAGWINRVTTGVDLTITGFAPISVRGWSGQATLGELTVTGFAPAAIDLPTSFDQQATLGQLTVTGFRSIELISDHFAQMGTAGAVIGFAPTLSFERPPITWSPEPPPTVFYDPRNHLPPGWSLDRETEDDLMEYWASVDYRILTDGEIQAIVGAPRPNPTLRVEFRTGRYPERKLG